MCVWLPQWPLQRLLHEQPDLQDKPVALVNPRGRRGPQVVCCSSRAARAGIRAGMPLAEAQAIETRLQVCAEDPDRDFRSLGKLAVWAGRFSPFVGVEERPSPQALLLDVTGCAACFHGEDQLLLRAAREFAEQKWKVRVALADTIGAAWALAHHANTPFLARPAETENILMQLPVAALRLPEDAVRALAQLGIDQVRSLMSLDRDSIPNRFGVEVLRRLDQALGRLPEVLVPYQFLSEVRAVYPFAFPTDRLGDLRQALFRLAEQIQTTLQSRRWGARRLECLFYFETAAPQKIEIGLSRPSSSAAHLGAPGWRKCAWRKRCKPWPCASVPWSPWPITRPTSSRTITPPSSPC
jgi:protein ImuB